MDGTVAADVRKQKAIFILYAIVFVIAATLVIWMIDIRSFNTDVEDTQCQIDNIQPDGCAEYQSTLEYETRVKDRKRSYIMPVFLLLALVGVIIGFMFLPGYPFSKYLSYSECQQLNAKFPQDQWSWSTPQSGSDLLCKLFGACVCRSGIQEYNCQQYKNTSDSSATYNYDTSQKKNATKDVCLNRCACCTTVGGCNAIQVTGGNSGETLSYKPEPCQAC
jgi:hypothetical protein